MWQFNMITLSVPKLHARKDFFFPQFTIKKSEMSMGLPVSVSMAVIPDHAVHCHNTEATSCVTATNTTRSIDDRIRPIKSAQTRFSGTCACRV